MSTGKVTCALVNMFVSTIVPQVLLFNWFDIQRHGIDMNFSFFVRKLKPRIFSYVD